MKTALVRIAYGFFGLVLGAVFCGAAAILIALVYPGADESLKEFFYSSIGLLLGAVAGTVISQIIWCRAREAVSRGVSRVKLVFGLACWVIAPILATTGMVWASSVVNQPPSDSALLANFSRHQAEFDQIAQFCANDKRSELTDEKATEFSGEQSIGVPAAQIDQFRHLLRTAGVSNGEWQIEKREIDFSAWDAGTNDSVEGVEKGYAYMAHPPTEIVSRLDGYTGHPADPKNSDDIEWTGTGYLHISGPWYLYYSFDNDKL